MIYDVIIIGAGAGGIFTAVSIKNKKVLIIEKNKGPGRKILISGGGQCNYTNNSPTDKFLNKYGDKGKFIKPALYKFSSNNTVDFFNSLGVKSLIREDNKVFPASLKSEDILNALLDCCKNKGVELLYCAQAENILYSKENKCFAVKTLNQSYLCKNLVIATGGMSYPNTGSTGDGYKFAENFGHDIIKPSQALTPVYVKNYCFGDLSGISFRNVGLSHWRCNKKLNTYIGDVIFTHVNISGPVILNNSRYFQKGDILKFNFTDFKNEDEFLKSFNNKIINGGKLKVKTILREFNVPRRFVDELMKQAGISSETGCSQLSKTGRKKLSNMMSAFPVEIEKLGGYNVAMVTKGGVDTRQINPKTMESKLVKNLYFVGEVIDIDGDTGGYNIQAAFSTGSLAGENISNN